MPKIQELFSEYGCFIRLRVGLHDTSDDYCAPSGLILLEMTGGVKIARQLMSKLNKLDGIEAKELIFK